MMVLKDTEHLGNVQNLLLDKNNNLQKTTKKE